MEKPINSTSRRSFIKNSSVGAVALASGLISYRCLANNNRDRKLGIALCGLGNYSSTRLAPAFEHTEHCYLAGVVTGTPSKEKEWADKYGIPPTHIYNYENFDTIKDNPDIDIVYVVTPNSRHAEFGIRAAKAGKHVITEKPMEISVARAQELVDACKAAGKLLQVGYRNRYDPTHLEIMRLTREQVYGQVKVIDTNFSFYGINSPNWRFTDKSLSGGGPLMDIGVYCLEGACYGTGELPSSITAQSFKTFMDKLPDMEETITWQMEFPSGAIANCTSSYVARANNLHIYAEKGNYGTSPAYGYDVPGGYVGKEAMNAGYRNQQAAQMDAFAMNIKEGTEVIASGEVGVQGMKIIEAIYSAAKTGQKVELTW